jgi:hypothetical protein
MTSAEYQRLAAVLAEGSPYVPCAVPQLSVAWAEPRRGGAYMDFSYSIDAPHAGHSGEPGARYMRIRNHAGGAEHLYERSYPRGTAVA